MRNLKRALSLTLASVMLLGMMVVGSSAAAGYDDVADTDNVEAIEVLQAVEVMVGDERGFGPERPVNRAEMAVVMGKLLNLDYNYYEATCPFNDVYDWARGWVGACYANGIVSGRGEGVYDPGTTVTAVEAASMLMRALGYFKYQSDYASGFEVSTVLQANKIRLFDGVNSSTNEPLTRNQVAQMALNALKSGMVEPDGNALNFIDASGNVIATGGKVNYVFTTSNKPFATAIDDVKATSIGSSNDSPIVELGEQLYDGKLKLNDTTDVFGRPARKWEYDGKAIGTYAKKELMVMDNVGKVTGNDLYTLLGADTIKDYDVLVTIDGVDNKRNDAKAILGDKVFTEAADLNRNNKAEIGGTGTGVLTQVFVDHEDDEVYVAIINTYLARATRDYDDKSEEANLTVYSIDKHGASGEYFKVAKSTKENEAMKIQAEDFDGFAKDVKKDDAFLVNVADGEIQAIEPAEVLEAVTLSAFKLTDHVVSGGTNYSYTTTVGYKDGDLDAYTGGDITNLKDRTYNIYLDAYGNLIGLEEVDGVKNYVFLAGIDLDGSNLGNKTATANALFLDGTSKVIKINMTKSVWTAHKESLSNTNIVISGDALLNTWATYTVNGDVYTIKEVPSTNGNANNIPQPGVSGAANTTKYAQYWQPAATANNKVSVKNMRLYGVDRNNSSNGYSWVYGDSDSVYLTPELSELRNDSRGLNALHGDLSYGIIKDVDAVTTGIADTNITVWTRTQARDEAEKTDLVKDQKVNPTKVTDPDFVAADHENDNNVAYGIYTLYNDEGIVIAAVVVGENEGVKDLVYVHTDALDLESDNGGSTKAADDGLWTWTRRVIRDGQEVTLTEVGDTAEELISMEQYQWYEIKTNANGEVIDATPAYKALGSYWYADRTNYNGEFVALYEDINRRVEDGEKDNVLYQTDGGPCPKYPDDPDFHTHTGFDKNQKLEVKGSHTLAVTTKEGSGIHFRDNVNVVLQYWNQNTKKLEVETGTGPDRLKSMVDFVNDNSKYRSADEPYYVSALIEKGFATTIVIYDSYNNYKRPEDTVNYVQMQPTSTIADVNKALLDNNVEITGTWQPNNTVSEGSGRENTVYIPANRTLKINGDFIAYQNGTINKSNIYVTSANRSTSKLIVENDFYLAGQILDCSTTVKGDMFINTAPDVAGITYLDSAIAVSGNLFIVKQSGSDVRVTSYGNVTVGSNKVNTGNVVSVGNTVPTNMVTITVLGTMEYTGSDRLFDAAGNPTTGPIHWHVLSANTLKAGTLYGSFCVGSNTNAGRVVVNNLRTDAAANTCGSFGVNSSVNLQNGTLEINGYTTISKFQVNAANAPKIIFGKDASTDGSIFQTETNAAADVSGKTFTFTADKDGNVVVTDNANNKYNPGNIGSDGVVEEITGGNNQKPGETTLTVGKITIGVGAKETLKPVLKPADDKVTYTFKSNDETIATVDEQGVVTGVKEGTTTVTVTASNGLTADATVKVDATIVAVESVKLNKNSLTLAVNGTETLTATVTPTDATEKTVTWTSDDETVATVSDAGLVTAIKEGTATITATAGGKSDTCAVTVSNTPVADDSVKAKLESGPKYELYAYGNSVTVEQAKAAIKEAWDTANANNKATSVEIDGTKVTITAADGTKSNATIPADIASGALDNPKPLYSVKVNGTHKVYWDGAAALTTGLEGVGVKIAEKQIAVADSGKAGYVTVVNDYGDVSFGNDHVPTIANGKDINLVDAVKVQIADSMDSSVTFWHGEGDTAVQIDENTTTYVAVGTKVTAKDAAGLAAGASVYFSVDGETKEIKNSGAEAATAGDLSITFNIATPKTGDTVAINQTSVFVATIDGNPVETYDGKAVTKTSTIKVNSKYVLLASQNSQADTGSNKTKTWFEATEITSGNKAGYWLALADNTVVDASTVLSGNTLALATAYMVEAPANGWTAGTNSDGTAIADGSDKLLVKKATSGDTEMYIALSDNDASTTLKAVSGKGITGMTTQARATLPTSAGVAATGKNIYKCVINGDVNAESVAVNTEIELDATQANADVTAATNTVTYTTRVGDGEEAVIKFKSTGLAGKTFDIYFVADTGATATIKDNATTVTAGTDGTFSVTISMTTAGGSGKETAFGKLVVIAHDVNADRVGMIATLVNKAS